MKTVFITAAVAMFLGQQNVSAISLNQKSMFVDDVVRLLAEAEKEDLKEEEEDSAHLSQCNPCPNSSAGKNPHYPYVAKAGGDKKEGDEKKDEKKDALAQSDCNPCYQSNKGKNPHYPYSGPPPAMPGYQPGQDPAGGEKMAGGKKDDKKEGLA